MKTAPRPAQTRDALATAEAPALDAPGQPPARFAYRIEEIADGLGVSRRLVERERSAGRFPSPSLHIGKLPLWSPEAIREWVARGGGKP